MEAERYMIDDEERRFRQRSRYSYLSGDRRQYQTCYRKNSDEPKQSMPYFYGKPNEWENFWMKFEILTRKYHWDEDRQRENLILCMRDDAASFTTSLSDEIRGSFIRDLEE